MMGKSLISDSIEIGAADLFYLCRNHPFVDGNKRTALAACLVFLESNNFLPNAKLETVEWEEFVLDVAARRLDREETTARLRKLLKGCRARSVSLKRRNVPLNICTRHAPSLLDGYERQS